MKKMILILVLFLQGQASCLLAQAFDKKAHEGLLEVQSFVNDVTLQINRKTIEEEKVLTEKLKKTTFSPFIAHLKKDAEHWIATIQTGDKFQIRTQQVALIENMYLAYLKANHEELLESEWHHAEAEMAHALAEATRRWHLCDMDITVQYITETPIPASKGVALHPFWEAWTKYKDQINTRTPQERLDFYNLVLVNLCNNFIDLAAKKDVYMPHQMYLMPCNLTEAGAEGK